MKVAAWLSANKITTYVEPAAHEDLYHLPMYTSLLPNYTPPPGFHLPPPTPSRSSPIVVPRDAPHIWHTPPPPQFPCGWQDKIDMVVCIGGDGTLLHMSSLFRGAHPPVVAFGCGSLGFLMPFDPNRYHEVLTEVLEGRSVVIERERMMFNVGGTEVRHPVSRSDPYFQVLNEVVVKRSHSLSGVSEIDCYIDGDKLARFQGDGLIVATATGSTAYSMASGGSIVHPSIDCLLLSPLCSMTLSSRPLIIPGNSTISLRAIHDDCYLEGKYSTIVRPSEVVNISRSPHAIPCFTRKSPTADWVHDLGHRLMYERQVRVRQVDEHSHHLDDKIFPPTEIPPQRSSS